MENNTDSRLGASGRFAKFFLNSSLTPLLSIICLLLGGFAFLAMPREEEPQTYITIVDVMIPYPGASASEVERTVLEPVEQLFDRLPGLEHIAGVANADYALVTLQFETEMPRTAALVEFYSLLGSKLNDILRHPGIQTPVIKVHDVDDVTVLSLTLFSEDESVSRRDLEKIANSMEANLQLAPGVREVRSVGGPGWAILVEVDPGKLALYGVTVDEIQSVLKSANVGAPVGSLIGGNQVLSVESNAFIESVRDVGELIVGAGNGQPIFLKQVASIREGPPPATQYSWYGEARVGHDDLRRPAVTLLITKQAGENVSSVVSGVLARAEAMRGTLIPENVEMRTTRDMGVVANENTLLLFKKIIVVTVSIVILIYFALGWREAAIVMVVVIFTLAMTLFCAWAFGFTLNRSSLFSLIIALGILVDDAVVVIENIHRHHRLFPDKSLLEVIPGAVDEIGGPTILATFTVIAALSPMLFVSGMPGQYFRPVPAITNMGMIMSLLIAFAITPWLSMRWMKHHAEDVLPNEGEKPALAERLAPLFTRFFEPLLNDKKGKLNRWILALIIFGAITFALLLPILQVVKMSLQPYANKSNIEVILNMPVGTPVEKTARVLNELADYVAIQPEIMNYQIYAGTHGSIGMNGLIRKYYLRRSPQQGSLYINLQDTHHRDEKSHDIVLRMRSELTKIASKYAGEITIFDPPPGLPTLSPITIEVYGPSAEGRRELAARIRERLATVPGIADLQDSAIADGEKFDLTINQKKAAALGVRNAQIVENLGAGLAGADTGLIHDLSKYPVVARVQLPERLHGDLNSLLQLGVRAQSGNIVPLKELVQVERRRLDQPIFHKDMLPVHYVLADVNPELGSPVLAILELRKALEGLADVNGNAINEYAVRLPETLYEDYSYKWDGEWQLMYDTFRDLSAAYVVGLILIYLLIVSQFSSYVTPLIIMAPIPLTLIGINCGHALLRTDFTITSMIGLMVLAGLLVRNSILLVDFIRAHVAAGVPFKEAVIRSANVRAQPIILTSLSAMIAALFLVSDPMFNGLAVALIFGNLVSTALTLVVIPTMYYAVYSQREAVNN
jgi:multidrug efflux pump subunit AcrB